MRQTLLKVFSVFAAYIGGANLVSKSSAPKRMFSIVLGVQRLGLMEWFIVFEPKFSSLGNNLSVNHPHQFRFVPIPESMRRCDPGKQPNGRPASCAQNQMAVRQVAPSSIDPAFLRFSQVIHDFQGGPTCRCGPETQLILVPSKQAGEHGLFPAL